MKTKDLIAALKIKCAELFVRKTAFNRYYFAVYSEKLKRLEFLYAQQDFKNPEYRQLRKEVMELI